MAIVRRKVKLPGLSKTCESCGSVFYRKTCVTYLQWSHARFCSKRCKWDSNPASDKHYKWRGGDLAKTCAICGVAFTVGRYRTKAAYCSYRCKARGQDRGISTENEKLRKSLAYKAWRTAVFHRDNYTCQSCGVRGGVLNADHIHPFALYPALRFDIDNGRTMCDPCHRATPTYGRAMIYWQRQEVLT